MIATIMIAAMIQVSTYRHPAFRETFDRNPAYDNLDNTYQKNTTGILLMTRPACRSDESRDR